MKIIIKISLFFMICLNLYAVESGGIDFNIRFFDRRIYYVNTDPILVQITIINNSAAPFRFKLADERAFSIDFDIRTMTNRALSASDTLTRRKAQTFHVFFRDILIETGESFSFIEDLRDYAKFDHAGSFRVRAKIYPELQREEGRTAATILESNYLALNLRPALIHDTDGLPIEMDIATGAALRREPMPPDEVVSYTIRARQESHWERFFLYIDLEAIISRDPVLRRRFQAENEEGRQQIVNEYRRNLQNSTGEDKNIVLIPTSFEIQNTEYSSNEGIVTLIARIRHRNHTEFSLYKYYLERRDNIWFIVSYTVESMGTQAN